MLAEFIQLQNSTTFDLTLPPTSVHVTDESSIPQIPQTTEQLWMNSKMSPQIASLSLSSFSALRTVIIGFDCLKNVRTFTVDGLPVLECFIVNEASCYSANSEVFFKQGFEDSSPVEGECRICNCPRLECLRFAYASFSLYRLLELKNLPSLCSFSLWDCYSFCKCRNLVLEGIPFGGVIKQIYPYWRHSQFVLLMVTIITGRMKRIQITSF